jgi:hypothetical protein
VAATKPVAVIPQVRARETTARPGSALGRQSSPIGVPSLSRASAHSSPAFGGFERLRRAVLVRRGARLDERVAIADRRRPSASRTQQHRHDERRGAALAAAEWNACAAAHSGLAAADDRVVAQACAGQHAAPHRRIVEDARASIATA